MTTISTGSAIVIGLGTMGAGIAEVFAREGWRVYGIDRDQAALDRGHQILASSTDRAVAKGKLSPSDRDALLARISVHTDLDDASEVDLVVEAAVEDVQTKRDIFADLGARFGAEVILATNTSSLSVTEIASAAAHPERVVGLHFFNPAPVQQLVEIVTTVHTADTVSEQIGSIVDQLGKVAIQCGDRAGFVVNRLLVGYLNRAIRLLQDGFASRDEIDQVMVTSAGYPMGPFELCDLVGLDVVLAVVEQIWSETRDRIDAPAPLLRQLVAAGRLGRKSGLGFGTATEPDPSAQVNRARRRETRVDELPGALVLPYLNEALRMVESGYASCDDIDTGMQLGCRMPGPFDLIAEIGVVPVLTAQQMIFAETAEPAHRPCHLLEQLAAADDPAAALAALRRPRRDSPARPTSGKVV